VGRFWRSAGVFYPYPVLPLVRSRTEDSHLGLDRRANEALNLSRRFAPRRLTPVRYPARTEPRILHEKISMTGSSPARSSAREPRAVEPGGQKLGGGTVLPTAVTGAALSWLIRTFNIKDSLL
jgi:hypothetical protein